VVLQSAYVFARGSRHIQWWGPLDLPLARRLVGAMVPLGIATALSTTYFWADSILLRELAGEAEAGAYQHAYRLLSFSLALPIYFCHSLLPIYSRLAAEGPARLTPVVQRSVFYMACVAFPAAALAPALGPAVLDVVWDDPHPDTAACLNWLAGAGALIFLTYPQIHALIAAGRQKTCALISLAGGGFKIGLGVATIPALGIRGAAMTTFFTELVVLLLVTAAHRVRLGALGPSWRLWRPAFAAALVGGTSLIFEGFTGMGSLAVAMGLLIGGAWLAGVVPFDLKGEAP